MAPFFFIQMNNKYVNLQFSDIKYIEEGKQHVLIVAEKETYRAPASIEQVEAQLPADQFCRIHKSFIVNLDHVQFFTNEIVQLEDKTLPIGVKYKDVLAGKIVDTEMDEEIEEQKNEQ